MAYLVVLVTAKDQKEGAKIARAVVEEGLVACCNIVPNIRSIYRWQGKVCDEREVLLVMKTTRKAFASLEKRVRALHSYSVVEVLAIPVVTGSKPYLKWLGDSVVNRSPSTVHG